MKFGFQLCLTCLSCYCHCRFHPVAFQSSHFPFCHKIDFVKCINFVNYRPYKLCKLILEQTYIYCRPLAYFVLKVLLISTIKLRLWSVDAWTKERKTYATLQYRLKIDSKLIQKSETHNNSNFRLKSQHAVKQTSINQSINHLFVLNSTRNKYNGQYTVEQDTKAWSTYRCPKLSL